MRRYLAVLLATILFTSGCMTVDSSQYAQSKQAGFRELARYTVDDTSYRSTLARNGRVRFLVLHYTAADFAESVRLLTGQDVSAHYLVPSSSDVTYQARGHRKVKIFQLMDEADRAWHAGQSFWQGRSNLNDSSIGIEMVNLATKQDGVFNFPEFDPEQIEAFSELALDMLRRFPDIDPTRVVAHSDVAYTRKSDPGPAFPWKHLSALGVGAWYDEATKEEFERQFNNSGLPPLVQLLKAFATYGYAMPRIDDAGAICSLVRAFQMHFRPANHNGVVDEETAAILYALNHKYPH
jgi:N-acetylmuramoyl-L-alanine amidase